MKKCILILLVIVFLPSCSKNEEIKKVSVTVGYYGYSDDRIHVAVEKRSDDMKEAQEECEIIFTKIESYLTENEYRKDEYNVAENSSYIDNNNELKMGKYVSRKAFDIVVTKESDPDSLMNDLRELGATGVHRNVYERSSKKKEIRDLPAALGEGRKRAEKIANSVGLNLGEIISIDEMDYGIDDSKVYNIKFEMK